MHILGDEQKRGNKNRTSAERFFKRFNQFVLAVQFACFLIALSQVSIAAEKTFEGSFWFPADAKLLTMIEQKTENCTMNIVDTAFGFKNVHMELNSSNQALFFMELSYFVRMAIVINGVAIFCGAVNKLLFDLNVFEIRYRNIYFHKELATTVELGFIGYSYQLVTAADPAGDILRRYLKHCSVESRTSLPFSTPMIALYFNLSFVIFIHFITLMIHFKNTLKKPKKLEYSDEGAQPNHHPIATDKHNPHMLVMPAGEASDYEHQPQQGEYQPHNHHHDGGGYYPQDHQQQQQDQYDESPQRILTSDANY